jgi:antitoxin YefM
MQVTYTETKNTFTSFYDMVIDRREPLYIQRRGYEDLVLLPAIELESLNETAYLLRSPKNAKRLLEALQSSFEDQAKEQTIEELKKEVGFE